MASFVRSLLLGAGIVVAACGKRAPEAAPETTLTGAAPVVKEAAPPGTLAAARQSFASKLRDRQPRGEPAKAPPPGVLDLVRYPSQVGPLAAYVSPAPPDGKKHPAIVWLTSGFDNGIDDAFWRPAPSSNDPSARAFREAGIVLLAPSLRGGNDNPGRREILLGEVDDVVAAAEWVAKLPYVDPDRVYLGGHGPGGTLALLVAASTPRFRAVFAFGPVADARSYAGTILGLADENEARVRSPIHYMKTIRTPTFLIEGGKSLTVDELAPLQDAAGGAPVKAFSVDVANHFDILAPATAILAKKILADTGPTSNITLP
jgi:dienelactone hydrolase